MKIAITGTKGIPNRYGGFEQLAEFLSVGLVSRGHHVMVYNPYYYPYKNSIYKGVQILYKKNFEKKIGPFANIIYDYSCIKDAVSRNCDIVFECGYASAIQAFQLLNLEPSKIITHVDGLEWLRPKWSKISKQYIKAAERKVTHLDTVLVCDHESIADYYKKKYQVSPVCIRYGAKSFRSPNPKILDQYLIEPNKYFLAIARLEPENHIEGIIQGYLESNASEVLIIIGQNNTRYGRSIRSKYGEHPRIWIKEGIYNIGTLNNLRYFAKAYFHGHSVGGSNPSLLEAMASGAFIISHDNEFNRNILENNGLYFSSSDDIKNILRNIEQHLENKAIFQENNQQKISDEFRWERIIDEYEALFKKVLAEG